MHSPTSKTAGLDTSYRLPSITGLPLMNLSGIPHLSFTHHKGVTKCAPLGSALPRTSPLSSQCVLPHRSLFVDSPCRRRNACWLPVLISGIDTFYPSTAVKPDGRLTCHPVNSGTSKSDIYGIQIAFRHVSLIVHSLTRIETVFAA